MTDPKLAEEQAVCAGSGRLSHSTRLAAEFLAHVVAGDHGCRQGKTALYWALIATVLKHARRPPAEDEK